MQHKMRDIIGCFVWERGSLNDNGIHILKDRMIPYQYYYQQLYARDACGRWCRVEYEKLPPFPGRCPDTWRLLLNPNEQMKGV